MVQIIDFAYRIHTEIGNKQLVPLWSDCSAKLSLKTGDVVEINK